MSIGEYDSAITVSAMNATPASITVPVHLSVTMSGIAPDAGGVGPAPDGSVGAGGGSGTGAGGSSIGAGTTTGSVGGATGSGGSSTTGGVNTTTGAAPGSGDDGGCGCRVGQSSRDSLSWGAAGLLLLASLAARRRRPS
jgi:MYXO-CTERM domain-containing protein